MYQKVKKNYSEVSIILTCFNEGSLLEKTLKEIREVMHGTSFSYEIIFVDDKSQDNSIPRIQSLFKKFPHERLKLLINPKNQGRGFSVSRGIKESKAEIVGFIDPDLEIPALYIPHFIRQIKKGHDLAISWRRYSGELLGLPRVFASHFYSFLVSKKLSLPLHDTEAGLKFFRRKTILPVLKKIKDKHWFWDTEVMARSFFAGLKIKEIPTVVIKNKDKKSTVHLFADTFIYLKNLYAFSNKLKEGK